LKASTVNSSDPAPGPAGSPPTCVVLKLTVGIHTLRSRNRVPLTMPVTVGPADSRPTASSITSLTCRTSCLYLVPLSARAPSRSHRILLSHCTLHLQGSRLSLTGAYSALATTTPSPATPSSSSSSKHTATCSSQMPRRSRPSQTRCRPISSPCSRPAPSAPCSPARPACDARLPTQPSPPPAMCVGILPTLATSPYASC
jgi:hypothetical protein